MTTPPGWYPDPGQIPDHPPQERWWDGSAWTENRRPAAGFPPVPPPPPGRAGRGPLIAGLVGAVVLVAALAVGAVLLLGGTDDDSGGDEARPGSSAPKIPKDKEPAPDEEPPDEEPPTGEPELPTTPPDADRPAPADGVRLPKLNGWEGSGGSVMIGTYDCPGDAHEKCLRGGSSIVEAEGKGPAKEIAETDVERNAKSAYNADTYGGITSHKVIEKGKVKVAGEDGYRVRWKIKNKIKPDAYVESVAFPHPDGSGEMLVVRSGFDIHKDAPPLSDMDKLVDGVSRGSAQDDGSRENV
ncbi:DUF2510 domain-containing protein [Streptomyces albiaxialis]|uniref:DUF2510 domain-containing protein n=1 Tax=Streptomyces albiaxialis TaxID=329523 RepID=A0ABN2X2F1_9ACTN